MLTLGQAAAQAGLNKTTLRRAIDAGKLSAQRLDDGSYRIDPSELGRYLDHRAATVAPQSNAVLRDSLVTEVATPETLVRLAVAEALLKETRERLEEVRAERDSWKGQAERLALTAAKVEEERAKKPEQDTRSGFWSRVFGSGRDASRD